MQLLADHLHSARDAHPQQRQTETRESWAISVSFASANQENDVTHSGKSTPRHLFLVTHSSCMNLAKSLGLEPFGSTVCEGLGAVAGPPVCLMDFILPEPSSASYPVMRLGQRQTDSFAHWNSLAGGTAVKTSMRQLIGRLFGWVCLGPHSLPATVDALARTQEPRKGKCIHFTDPWALFSCGFPNGVQSTREKMLVSAHPGNHCSTVSN
ncbi:uncharacterized protein LOC143435512 isoform X2 [Arvicanthis niloticus]|uniref:uncharacterized protein LOC143309880 isoform X2 n=1 Tax=Arvicanthis niloticus TaxID=61156 RepID=UPI00402BA92D